MEAVRQLIRLNAMSGPIRLWAHWRLSLTGVSSCFSAGAEGRGGASHRQRRMMRWQTWRAAELLLVEG